jgi:DNA-binding PadR family transcriptional regulator
MRIPLYILGLLMRFGPQHGYQIRKIIGEELADFTQIKLSVIYYHLEKMEGEGLVRAAREKTSGRPEKTSYSVTEKGRTAFRRFLDELLLFEYHPTFASDGLFYFSDTLSPSSIKAGLERHIHSLRGALDRIEAHKAASLSFVPEEARTSTLIIFSHHEHHYQAEIDWAQVALRSLEAGVAPEAGQTPRNALELDVSPIASSKAVLSRDKRRKKRE